MKNIQNQQNSIDVSNIDMAIKCNVATGLISASFLSVFVGFFLVFI